jgi:hypothetical protein
MCFESVGLVEGDFHIEFKKVLNDINYKMNIKFKNKEILKLCYL